MEIYFHTGEDGIPNGLRTDVIVLHDMRFLGEEELVQLASGAGRVVLAGGLPWKLRNFVQRWCTARNIPCHDVREQGAFVLGSEA